MCGIATHFMGTTFGFHFARMGSWDREVELFGAGKLSLVKQRPLKQHRKKSVVPASIHIYMCIYTDIVTAAYGQTP